jgi:periplasmic divalent cation tolerance protein
MSEPDAEIRVLFVTAPAEVAAVLVGALVERRLVACGNILPGVRSIYAWKGEVCDEPEVAIVLETTAACLGAAMQAILGLHPYECPKVIALEPVAVHSAYAAWVGAAVSVSGTGVDP